MTLFPMLVAYSVLVVMACAAVYATVYTVRFILSLR